MRGSKNRQSSKRTDPCSSSGRTASCEWDAIVGSCIEEVKSIWLSIEHSSYPYYYRDPIHVGCIGCQYMGGCKCISYHASHETCISLIVAIAEDVE